jgi:predicted histone-like DNA-binding protein
MISYHLNQRVNPRSPSDTRKYYAYSKATGTITLRELAQRISRESTVSMMDTVAVLEGLLQVIPDMLLDGNIVRLGDFGTFRLSLSSEGVENPDEFNISKIRRTNLIFRAGKVFQDRLKTVKFTRAKNASVSS